jgi:uncharacterized protein
MVAKSVKKYLPAPEKVSQHKLLRWLGPRLTQPSLWRINRRSVSLGLAIGVFWGFILPLAQIPFAALAALFLRANLPVAVVSTLVTNPFTFAPVYFLAYQVGQWVLGDGEQEMTQAMLAEQVNQMNATELGWFDQITGFGAPLFTGLVIFAVTFSVGLYFVVNGVWRLAVVMRYRKRRRPSA